MPKPRVTAYPKFQKWRFVQRDPKDDELVQFSQAIRDCDGQNVDRSLRRLLRFQGHSNRSQRSLKRSWLQIWVNIMHQMGLGYTSSPEDDETASVIRCTDLGRYIADSRQYPRHIQSYYYYWALKFQFPFGFPKHKHYIDHGVAVQPAVLILKYLTTLKETRDINEAYLTRREITFFLMRSTNHDIGVIRRNCLQILRNRRRSYGYSNEARVAGFEEAGKHFFQRGRLFVDRLDFLRFDKARGRVYFSGISDFRKAKAFLSYATPPVEFEYNGRDVRNEYFLEVYCNLDPQPDELRRHVLRARGRRGRQAQPTSSESDKKAERIAHSQGYALGEAKQIIELHAMKKAKDYLLNRLNYRKVIDVHRGNPYDFKATDERGSRKYIEVKGTRSLGKSILLTSGEVRFARRNAGRIGLVVVHSIELRKKKANGGTVEPMIPFSFSESDLEPTQFLVRIRK